MFKKTIENFLNEFSKKTIRPTDWDGIIFWFNVRYIAIEAVLITVIGGLILSILNFLPFINLNGMFFVVSLVIAIMRIMKHKEKFLNFLEVPVGNIGMITLLGEIKGSIDEDNQYHLVPGKYRDIVDIIFYKNIFDVIIPPTRFDNFDYHFEEVYTKDGVSIKGTHTGRPQLVDPWAWCQLMLATKDLNIHNKKVEDVSLEAMNNAADNLTLRGILKAEGEDHDGSDDFKNEYQKELEELLQLHPYKKPFLSDIDWDRERKERETDEKKRDTTKIFYFPETGLNIMFNIKTRSPMDLDLKEALAAEALATERKKAVVIDAEAEKEKLILEGQGKANAEKEIANAAAEAYETAFRKFKDLDLSNEVAAQKAALSANLYASEVLTEIGNSDGSPISGGGLDLVKIIALAKGLWKDKK